MSITAGQVAIELRKLADSLDREPEAAIEKPGVYLYHWGQKETFLALAKILPRPLTREVHRNRRIPRIQKRRY